MITTVEYKVCTTDIADGEAIIDGPRRLAISQHDDSGVFPSELLDAIRVLDIGEQVSFDIDIDRLALLPWFKNVIAQEAKQVRVHAEVVQRMQEDENHRESTEEEWIEKARQAKNRGNEAYSKCSYNRARREYRSALESLQHCKMEDREDEKGQEQRRERIVQELVVPCYLNLAAVELKLEEFEKATRHCDKVLRRQPGSLKASYRKVQALLGLGELDDAEKLILQCMERDSGNKTFARTLTKIKQTRTTLEEKERTLAKNMFSNA